MNSPCAGDCNGDGVVSVDELVTLADIALDEQDVAACPARASHDGRITVDDIVRAVTHAISGCLLPIL